MELRCKLWLILTHFRTQITCNKRIKEPHITKKKEESYTKSHTKYSPTFPIWRHLFWVPSDRRCQSQGPRTCRQRLHWESHDGTTNGPWLSDGGLSYVNRQTGSMLWAPYNTVRRLAAGRLVTCHWLLVIVYIAGLSLKDILGQEPRA